MLSTKKLTGVQKSQTIQLLAVDEKAIADALGMSLPWVRKDRRTKRILPFYRIGKSIRYDLGRVREALTLCEEGGAAR